MSQSRSLDNVAGQRNAPRAIDHRRSFASPGLFVCHRKDKALAITERLAGPSLEKRAVRFSFPMIMNSGVGLSDTQLGCGYLVAGVT